MRPGDVAFFGPARRGGKLRGVMLVERGAAGWMVPELRVETTRQVIHLQGEVTTVGRGPGVDVALSDPTVAPLHAELVRRGDHVYVADLGLSRAGTCVNGRLIARRVLADGDVVSFGRARVQVRGLVSQRVEDAAPLRQGRVGAPDLTARELDVLSALCRPAATGARCFTAPATVKAIAVELGVTEAAVKQHLTNLYAKFCIPAGAERRLRLANAALEVGTVRRQCPVSSDREAQAWVSRPGAPAR
jgi:DNA-binding CsgD family transcriptional regulator